MSAGRDVTNRQLFAAPTYETGHPLERLVRRIAPLHQRLQEPYHKRNAQQSMVHHKAYIANINKQIFTLLDAYSGYENAKSDEQRTMFLNKLLNNRYRFDKAAEAARSQESDLKSSHDSLFAHATTIDKTSMSKLRTALMLDDPVEYLQALQTADPQSFQDMCRELRVMDWEVDKIFKVTKEALELTNTWRLSHQAHRTSHAPRGPDSVY